MEQKKTIEQLLEMSRQEQNKYLATLPRAEAKELARKIFKAETDRHVQQLVDNLNSNAKKDKARRVIGGQRHPQIGELARAVVDVSPPTRVEAGKGGNATENIRWQETR